MPNVTTLLSGGVSVGILAGVVSGLFYLVVAGIRWAGEVKKLQSGEWLYKQVQRRFCPPAIQHDTHDCNNGVGMDPESAQVREFIERLVESLVSGGLDDVCVKKLHSHPEYERMFACHHAPLCEALARLAFALQMAIANKPMPEQESPSSAHSALKQLIQTIIREAMTLPTLQGLNHTPENGVTSEDMTSKTYEDILATAILNKVIEQYQLDGNKNLLASPMEQKPTYISRLEIGVKSPDTLEDEQLHSLSNSDIVDPMSLTIEECIEEVTTFSNPEEDNETPGDGEINFLPGLDFVQSRRVPFPELGMDILEGPALIDLSDHEDNHSEDDGEDRTSPLPTDLINPVESWEENWLFQRRRLKNGATPQSMPVPMLVPNPSEDYRALIGDRDAEEISDLSDCSDEALENLVLAEEESEPDPELLSVAESEPKLAEEKVSAITIVIHESEPIQDYESSSEDRDELLEAKNTRLVKSSSVDCLSEFGQQESEYTEDYAAATQRQLDSLSGASDQDVPSSMPQTKPSPQQTKPDPPTEVSLHPEADQKPLEEETPELAVPPRPGTDQSDDEYCTLPATGTIAEREHKKWESAPPLPNNPYSPENISKRLNKRDHFNNRSSSSEASVEFPDFKSGPVERTVIEKPLQIVCAPSDLDQKRYSRDYYINSKSPTGDRSPRVSVQSHAPQVKAKLQAEVIWPNKEENYEAEEKLQKTDSEDNIQTSNLVESQVARLQKEINQNEQWYKNMLLTKSDINKNSTENNKTVKSSDIIKDLHKFTKVIISNTEDEEERKPVPAKNTRDFSKRQQIPQEDLKHETIYGKSSFKQIKFPTIHEQQKSPEIQIEKKLIMDENYIEACLNGSGRSDSPSGSSVISTDSEFSNLPSVKELTKRFTTMADSDSSTSTPKSPSPAPRWKSPEQLPPVPAERTVLITGQNNLNASRPVREVHSLTARSISREFREGLRRNLPAHLDRNIYNQSGSYTSLSNGDSSSIPSSDDQELLPPLSEVKPRTVSSNIAFWEQLQQDKP